MRGILRSQSLFAFFLQFSLTSLLKSKYNIILCCLDTVCPRSSYSFYIVSYYTNWVNTSWTYSIIIWSFFQVAPFSSLLVTAPQKVHLENAFIKVCYYLEKLFEIIFLVYQILIFCIAVFCCKKKSWYKVSRILSTNSLLQQFQIYL